MKKIIVAIDGPSGSGKSTVAKLLAKKLGYTYIGHRGHVQGYCASGKAGKY